MATSLSEKFCELANTTPVFHDPEEDIFPETRARVENKYEEEPDLDSYSGSSKLRQRNLYLLADTDSRYSGRKISRKTLEELSSESGIEESEDELSEEDIEGFKAQISTTREEQIQIDHSSEENSNEKESAESGSSTGGSDDDQMEESDEESDQVPLVPEKDMVQKFSQIDINQELLKGKAVQAQLALWDKLLECRIKAQKMLSVTNRLPQPDTWQAFMNQGGDEYQQIVQDETKLVKNFLEKLVTMQEKLLQKNPEIHKNATEKSTKPPESDEEIPSGTEDEAVPVLPAVTTKKTSTKKRKLRDEDVPGMLEKRHKDFVQFRNNSIQKWSDKTRLASGKIGHKSFAAFEQSAVKQIEQVLCDKDRLRKRTQLKRSTYRVLGKEETQEIDMEAVSTDNISLQDRSTKNDHLKNYDPEIFDDDDFYHQLLRELIERKTADVNDPIAISRQWLEIQKLRSKIKRKVDTKASKGRKIRFDVHAKLMNFMAPIDNHGMPEEARDELFSSLFGKRSFQNS